MTKKPLLTPVNISKLSGWNDIDQIKSLQAFVRSCVQMLDDNRAFSKNPQFGGEYADWQQACTAAKGLGTNITLNSARAFFENEFKAFQVLDPDLENGLFTGYFEPELAGSFTKTEEFKIPVYARPKDLIVFNKQQKEQTGLGYGRLDNGVPKPYFTRKQIELGVLEDKNLELLWLKNLADRFFLQIQGSGRIVMQDGKVVRLAYAGKTGLPYTPIGAVLIEMGELEKSIVSMQTIRGWIDNNSDKAQALMWHNKSFVFFRKLDAAPAEQGPVGAQLVNLSPSISLAIDRRYWAFGTPVFLDLAFDPKVKAQSGSWRSLMVAQDTGSAIRGYARGDVFWGSGNSAGQIAGKMKANGNMFVLLPNKLAKKLKI